MARLKDILEPGETVQVTDPPVWLRRAALAGGLAVAGFMIGLPLSGFGRGDKIDNFILVAGLLGGAIALGAMAIEGRWRLLITDRRILARNRILAPGLQQMRRENVKEVSFRPMGLTVSDGKDGLHYLGVTAFLFQRAAVRAAFDPTWEKDGAPLDAAPRPESDETVLARGRRNIWNSVFPGMMLMFLGSIFVDMGYESFLEDRLSVLPLMAGFLLMAVAFAALLLVPALSIRDIWTITDRRFIVKRGLLRPEFRQMRLDEIEQAGYDGGELALTGSGQTLYISGESISATLLARLLPRWLSDPGQPMTRLGRILQPGEAVVFRYPSAFFFWGMRAVFVAAALATFWFAIGALAAGEWSDAITQLFLVTIFLSILVDGPFAGKGWQTVVTNRRLLESMDRDPGRYEDIALAELEIENPGGPGEIFTLRHGEREIPILTESAKAEKCILAAIARASGRAP